MARLTPAARSALAQERRQQIAQAALQVFSARGYEQATVREIARRAGLAEGTVYLYFRSKQDLLVAAWESLAFSRLLASLRRAETVRPGDEEETLAAILQDQFRTLLHYGPFFRLVMHRADVDREFRALARSRVREFQEEVAGLLQRLVQRGTLSRLDPEVVVRCLAALIRGLVLFDRYDPQPLFDRYPVEAVAREVARFVLYGLLPRKTQPRRSPGVSRRGGRR